MRGWVFCTLLLPRLAFAYGEPNDAGEPSHRERLLHVLSNQIRQGPHAWPGWDTSLATANARTPLALDPNLGAAARFHANDMATNRCFQHESCDGTPFQSRLGRYFGGPAGENIYTSTGFDSVREALTGWMTSAGHRRNLLTDGWTSFGGGYSKAGNTVYYVQNFGEVRSPEIPPIPGAAAEVLPNGLQLLANFWDPSGKEPTRLIANLAGDEYPLAKIAGGGGNSTHAATVAAPATCVALYFEASREGGAQSRFPSNGALMVGSGCTAEFQGTVGPSPSGPKVIDADEFPTGCQTGRGQEVLAAWALIFGGFYLRRKQK